VKVERKREEGKGQFVSRKETALQNAPSSKWRETYPLQRQAPPSRGRRECRQLEGEGRRKGKRSSFLPSFRGFEEEGGDGEGEGGVRRRECKEKQKSEKKKQETEQNEEPILDEVLPFETVTLQGQTRRACGYAYNQLNGVKSASRRC
jgi:hypothetical protein